MEYYNRPDSYYNNTINVYLNIVKRVINLIGEYKHSKINLFNSTKRNRSTSSSFSFASILSTTSYSLQWIKPPTCSPFSYFWSTIPSNLSSILVSSYSTRFLWILIWFRMGSILRFLFAHSILTLYHSHISQSFRLKYLFGCSTVWNTYQLLAWPEIYKVGFHF